MATQTAMRWCHSSAPFADGLAKAKVVARAAWDLLVPRGRLWKLTYGPECVSDNSWKKNGNGMLDYWITELTRDMPFEEADIIYLVMYQVQLLLLRWLQRLMQPKHRNQYLCYLKAY